MKRLLVILGLLCGVPSFAQVSWLASGTGLSFAQSTTAAASSGAYTYASHTPNATSHAVVITALCSSASAPSACSVSASAGGWSFTAIKTCIASPCTTSTGFACSWGAITPNTTATTFTVTFTGGGNCADFGSIVVNEASGNDTTGGTTTFYASGTPAANTTGGCQGASVTSSSANDGVVGTCFDSLATSNWHGTGWANGTNDTQGDASETQVVSGTLTPTWSSSTGSYVQFSAVVKAAGAGPTAAPRGKAISF